MSARSQPFRSKGARPLRWLRTVGKSRPEVARRLHRLALLGAAAVLGVLPGHGDVEAGRRSVAAAGRHMRPPPLALAEAGARDGMLSLLPIGDEGTALARTMVHLTGDRDAIRERRVVRALVTYNHTHYFLDGARQRGITYESLRLFEEHLNAKYRRGGLPISVVVIPVTPDQLLSRLVAGYGDIAAGALTITEERRRLVDFADPAVRDIREIVVTGPGGPPDLQSVEDLSGREVWVRPSSSYRQSLDALNERLRVAGRAPVTIRAADEVLEDEDLLEMVNAGLIGITVADDYLVDFWKQVFDELTPHHRLVVRNGGELAWAVRKGRADLRAEVNEFVAMIREGTLTGNVLLDRYLGTTRWVHDALAREDLRRFQETIRLFRRYADEYGFDWLLCVAQGYQESGLDQTRRSPAGALGIMQVRPGTALDPRIGIPNLESLESNIHAGLKYLRWIVDTYFDGPDIDDRNRLLFAFAAYNAGPARIARLREDAERAGFDPNVWFRSVELEAARQIGREPVEYVRNIFKYYVAYRLVVHQIRREEEARARFEGDW